MICNLCKTEQLEETKETDYCCNCGSILWY